MLVAGVTKHSSLARGGAPLVGQLELEAAVQLGARATADRTGQAPSWEARSDGASPSGAALPIGVGTFFR